MSSILDSISAGNFEVCKVPQKPLIREDSIIDILDDSTGFGEGNVIHYQTTCKVPPLHTPLYQENYLSEFKTEEEKAAARHALGLYNKGDVVAMSLITAEDEIPNQHQWSSVILKQMRKGDEFFAPVTSFNAVFDSTGTTLSTRINDIQSLIVSQQKELKQLIEPTDSSVISSFGDVKLFLQGFTNGDNLHKTINSMNQEMLRFEHIGQMT
jgi:hypothetical protein